MQSSRDHIQEQEGGIVGVNKQWFFYAIEAVEECGIQQAYNQKSLSIDFLHCKFDTRKVVRYPEYGSGCSSCLPTSCDQHE